MISLRKEYSSVYKFRRQRRGQRGAGLPGGTGGTWQLVTGKGSDNVCEMSPPSPVPTSEYAGTLFSESDEPGRPESRIAIMKPN